MKNIIHHLRNQPEKIRRHILHVTISVCAVILAFIWIYSLGTNLTNQDTQAKMGKDLQPISALKANFIDGYNSLSTPTGTTQ